MVLAAFDEKLALGTTQTFVFIIASYFAAKFGFYMAFWGMETGKQTPWEEE